MDLDAYRDLQRLAARLSAVPQEAEDLLQDALLAGLAAGRDDRAWLAGTMANLAAQAARSAVRRRRREAVVAPVDAIEATPVDGSADPRALLATLPPSARRVALLALHGLDAEEIRWILGIADTAFRQRLTRIRRALGELPPALRGEALALAYVRDPARSAALQFGLVRRALKAALNGRAGLGSHDPDGHLIVLRASAHISRDRGN